MKLKLKRLKNNSTRQLLIRNKGFSFLYLRIMELVKDNILESSGKCKDIRLSMYTANIKVLL